MNTEHSSARMAIMTEDAVPLILGKSSSERAKTTGYEIAAPSPNIIIEMLVKYGAISNTKETISMLILPITISAVPYVTQL